MADILHEILKVEEKAQEIVKNAQQEADGILQNARIEADKLLNESKNQIQKDAEKIISSAIDKTKSERDTKIKAIKEEDKRIEEETQKYIPEAVDFLINALAFNKEKK